MSGINDPLLGEEDIEESPEFKKNLKKAYKDKKISVPYKSKIRKLKQYADLTDEEFDELMAKKAMDIEPDQEWEKRIQIKLAEFNKDYDISDLKMNDKYALRALASATLHLEDYDNVIGKIKKEGIDDRNIFKLEKLSKIQEGIRSGISKLEDDLKISRKTRRSEKETDAISALETLKKKAKEFYEQKMMYIYCPECNMLLATMWFAYPDYKSNSIKLQCHRDLGGGLKCTGEVHITSEWLFNNGMRNKQDVPESLR